MLKFSVNPRDWVWGLYKTALSDEKASLPDVFGEFFNKIKTRKSNDEKNTIVQFNGGYF